MITTSITNNGDEGYGGGRHCSVGTAAYYVHVHVHVVGTMA